MVWGSNGHLKKQNVPVEYIDKDDEVYYLKGLYRAIKVCTSWSRSVSVSYLVMADVRYMEGKSPSVVEVLLKSISKEWEQHYTEGRHL